MNPNNPTSETPNLSGAHAVKVFAVVSNTDRTEGRGFPVTVAWALTPGTAKRLARGAGVMGTDARVEAHWGIKIGHVIYVPHSIELPTPEDSETDRRITAREQALAKAKSAGLSDDEIAMLRE